MILGYLCALLTSGASGLVKLTRAIISIPVVTWKVVGFGMILFVAGIQSIPIEINYQAGLPLGASCRQE